jgi:hypothetical protein
MQRDKKINDTVQKKPKKEEKKKQNEKENDGVLKTNFVRFEFFEKKR